MGALATLQQNQIFTKEQILNFAGFYNALKKVHNRLVSEGYICRNGELISPDSPPALQK
jgi:hypothetical protein